MDETKYPNLAKVMYGLDPVPAGRTRFLERHVVENRVYKNQRVPLDGYSFKNCAFIECDLHTVKGSFILEDCHITRCMATFNGSALRVVKFSSLILSTWNQLAESLRPTVEPDGGITVK